METIKLNIGKSSIVSLPSLATAGYLWSFQIDRKDIVSVSEDKSTSAAENPKPGENFPEKFRVQALKPGLAKLVFSPKRSWEQNSIATLIFSVIVS